MPRAARYLPSGVPVHVVQRGHNKFECFARSSDKATYLRMLEERLKESGCDVHAYVLMPNHVHLLMTPERGEDLSNFMRALNQRYAQHYFNRGHSRCGAVWQGRFFSSVIESEEYFMRTQIYIELNPVRGGLSPAAANYRWSSYAANVRGANSFVQPHELYVRLARDVAERRKAYEELVRQGLGTAEVEMIRLAIKRNRPLGTHPSRSGSAAKTKGPEGPLPAMRIGA